MKLLKEWRQRKTEEFRVWIAEYLFKTHIQPTLNHVNRVVDDAAIEAQKSLFLAVDARNLATEANERSAELGKLLGQLQKQVDAVRAATRYLAKMADEHIAEGH